MLPKILITFFLLGTLPSFAQDGHYWTQQYGTKSMLLSGSVIAGVEDLGAVYYNPGRLAAMPNAAFLLSANVYEYNSISISDAFGSSKNASKSDIKGVPTLAAGTFKIKSLPRHYFAYAFLTRQNSDLGFGYRDEVHKDVLASLPGDEYFGAYISLNAKTNEQWVGLTWSYAVTPKFSVGVTTNYTTSSQTKTNTIDMQVLSQANEVAIYRYNRSYTYKQNGLLWKIGLATELGKWQLGMTITTPTINLSGKGAYSYEEFFSPIAGMTFKPPTYSSSYQSNIDANYRTPWSIGFGATRALGRNKIHFSTEWYGGVSEYTLMKAADHISQSDPNDTIRFQLVDEVRSIWNAGIGAEIYLSEKVSGFLSFSTDFTTVDDGITRFIEREQIANNSSWNTDFYHVGGGVVLKLKGADITLGATHTGASEDIPRPVNFPEKAGDKIFGSGDTATLQWDRWRLVFSFSFPFLKDYANKLSDPKK